MRNLHMAWRLGTVGWALALCSVAALGWSCSDALRLEPPSGPGAGAAGAGNYGGGVVGGGGGAPHTCRSNSDCAAPSAVCDTVKRICVECLLLADCGAKPGTVCSQGACECPTAGESWCAPATCADLQISSDDCGSCGHKCFGACAAGKCVDEWEPTGADNAPDARSLHSAVWTGTAMIVWGGATADCGTCDLNTGAIYDPTARSWTKTSTVNAPSARQLHSAVWTGTEMLVWGGQHNGEALGTGGRFNPTTNTWKPISTANAPPARFWHTAVWTGDHMIVWGGSSGPDQLTSGATYDPATDGWVAIAAPQVSREAHSAVWNSGSMLIYGGLGDDTVDTDVYMPTAQAAGGMQYSPSPSESWNSLQVTAQPASRAWHTAVLMGSPLAMVVWGGYNGASFLGNGGSYTIQTQAWTATNPPEPEGRRYHTAVTFGDPATKMVVWGGEGQNGELDSGGVYTAADNSWQPTPTALSARHFHTAISTGTAMIVWGGQSGSTRLGDGGVYTPAAP